MLSQISYVILVLLLSYANSNKRTPRQLTFSSQSSCTTPDGDLGECYNIKECQSLLDLLKTSRHKPGVADFLRKSVCGYDRNDPRVCCPNSQSDQPFPNNNNNNNNANGRNSEEIRGNDDDFPELLSPPNCGKSSVQKVRIVGGQPSELGAWPWIAILGYRTRRNPTTQWLCGGALVSTRHVVTAAHCTKHPNLQLFKVRLGELDLNNNIRDGADPIDVNIERAIAHPSYNPQKYSDDIAVLRLQNEVPISKFIQPICLPKAAELRQMSFVNNFPFVAGWGSIQFRGPSLTALQEVQLPVVDNQECKEAYKKKGGVITTKQLCAGYARGGKDACQGDSGGPLMWPKGGSYYLIGVVSYGFRCAEPGFPGIYSRVTSYIDWIVQNMK